VNRMSLLAKFWRTQSFFVRGVSFLLDTKSLHPCTVCCNSLFTLCSSSWALRSFFYLATWISNSCSSWTSSNFLSFSSFSCHNSCIVSIICWKVESVVFFWLDCILLFPMIMEVGKVLPTPWWLQYYGSELEWLQTRISESIPLS